MLMKRHHRGKARIRQRAWRHLHVRDLDVSAGLFLTEPNRMDRYALPTDFRNGFEVHATGVVCAIACQHDRADGQARCIRHHLLETVSYMGGLRRRRELFQFVEPLQVIAQLIKSNLKLSL